MIFTTPLGTTGLGNPSAPTDTSVGSGDIPTSAVEAPKKKKKIKSLTDYLKKDETVREKK